MPDMTRRSLQRSRSDGPRRFSAARGAAGVATCLLALVAGGCIGGRGNVELLEARLRQHEDQIDRDQRALAATRAELDRARQEADLLRRQMADAGASPLPPEYTGSLFRVEEIRFNTLMTGGRDGDDVSGDELLVVVFAPYDEQGDLVKLPGRIDLEAFDPARSEEEGRRIASWTFTPDESRDLWRSSAFSAGFELRLVWPQPPQAERILLHARLSTADGRRFDASQTITITPEADGLAPGTFPVPPLIQPVHYESEAPRAETPVAERPTATPLELGTSHERGLQMADQHNNSRPSRPEQEPVLSTSDEGGTEPAPEGTPDIAEQDQDSDSTQEPRAFPDGLRTSDVWTEETIPRLR